MRAAFALSVALTAVATACGPNWDLLDPSLGNGGAGATSGTTSTGAGANGAGGAGCNDLDDGKDCTQDHCVDGAAVHTPLAKGAPCPTDPTLVCDEDGKCVECNETTDCKASGCQTGGTCKKGQCSGGNHAPAGTPCDTGGGKMCDGDGHCVECISNADCMAPETCGGGGTPNQCGCAGGMTCASLGLTCGVGQDGCGGMLACDDGIQDGNETDVDCGGGVGCAIKCGIGKVCNEDEDCQNDLCVDGRCCAGECGGLCMACDVSGSEGMCAPVPQLDTDSGCTGTMACDGSGKCKQANGQLCIFDDDCASGSCSGGNLVCR